jgi:hypothetical protein
MFTTGSNGPASSAASQSTQRSVAGAALSVINEMVNANQLGVSGSAAAPSVGVVLGALTSAAGVQPAVPAGGSLQAPLQPGPIPRGSWIPVTAPAASATCNNGVIFSASTATGVTTESIEFFFNASCTLPHRLETLAITPPSSSSDIGTAKGSVEVWDQAGGVIGYQTIALNFVWTSNGISEVSQLLTEASSPTSAPFAQQGNTCLFHTAYAVDCGQANAFNVASLNDSLGFTLTALGQSMPLSGGFGDGAWLGGSLAAEQITVAGSGYTGATGALTLQPASAPPAWVISGGTPAVALTGTVTVGFGYGDAVSAVNLKLTDAADGLTATLVSSTSGRLIGTVTNASGQIVATITLDRSGTGQISFTNGTIGQIQDWIILS